MTSFFWETKVVTLKTWLVALYSDGTFFNLSVTFIKHKKTTKY